MKKNLFGNMAVILIMLCFAMGIALSSSGKAFAQVPAMKGTDQKIEKLEKELKALKEAKEAKEKEQIEEKTEEKLNKKLKEIDKKIKKKEITSDIEEEEEQNYREYSDGDVKIGDTVNIAEDEVVSNDMVFIGCKVNLNGKITGDAVFIACNLNMGSKSEITGDVVMLLGRLNKEPGAKIMGDMIKITPFSFWTPDFHPNYHYNKEPALERHFNAIAEIVVKLIFFLILILLFPKKIQQVSETIEFEPGKSFLYGLLGTILIIPVALLLLVSIIGIPFIAAEIILIIVAVIMGYAGVALLLGRKIKTETKFLMGASLLVQALIGVLIIELVKLIPVIGMLFILLVYAFGFGAALMVFMHNFKKPVEPAPSAVIPAPQNTVEPPK